MLINRVQIPTKNFSSFWSFVRDVGHCMNMVLDRRKPVLGSQQWLQLHISFIMRFYYKMRCYSKVRQLFYYKIWQKSITKYVRFFFTKCNNFITKCNVYFKVRQLLQNTTFPTKDVGTRLSKTEADLKKGVKRNDSRIFKRALNNLMLKRACEKNFKYYLWQTRLVFSRFFDLLGNLRIVKEKPTRKTCFSREKKRLAPRIYQAKFCWRCFFEVNGIFIMFSREIDARTGESIFEKV